MTLIEFIVGIGKIIDVSLFTLFEVSGLYLDICIPNASIEFKAILTIVIVIAPVLGLLNNSLQTRRYSRR